MLYPASEEPRQNPIKILLQLWPFAFPCTFTWFFLTYDWGNLRQKCFSFHISKKFFFYLYVWSAIVWAAVHDNVLAGVGIGIPECEYGPGAGVSISGVLLAHSHLIELLSVDRRSRDLVAECESLEVACLYLRVAGALVAGSQGPPAFPEKTEPLQPRISHDAPREN